MNLEISVEELAHRLGGQAEGEIKRRITGVASLEAAQTADLSFLESERNLPQALGSRAGCLLALPGMELPGRTVIRVKSSRYGMARAIEMFHPRPPSHAGVHPTAQLGAEVVMEDEVEIGAYAVIGDGVRIGARTSIGAGCVLGEGVILSHDCLLYPRVTLYAGVRLGARVILHSGCVVGSDGFGFVLESGRYYKFPQVGTVDIGDDVEIGANTTIDRGALGTTRIGRGTKIDNLVQVAHNVQIGEHCAIAAQTGISGSGVIEDHVVIAGQVGLGESARVQKGAVLGGQCGILPHKIVRAGQTVWGTPARPLKEYLEQQALVARLPRLLQKQGSVRPRTTTEAARKDPQD